MKQKMLNTEKVLTSYIYLNKIQQITKSFLGFVEDVQLNSYARMYTRSYALITIVHTYVRIHYNATNFISNNS